nr:MAG TPA: hypothetical protein [Caudoviricetes sp.]
MVLRFCLLLHFVSVCYSLLQNACKMRANNLVGL